MKRRIIRLAVVLASAGGLLGILEQAAQARIFGNHCEPLR
jgi:NAD dependent epimerase/dehydratase family enzyme